MTLSSPLTEVKGVGTELAKKFDSLGIHTVADLLDYYPRRYDDYSNLQQIESIKPGVVSIQAVVKQVRGRYVRRGLHITEAVASDETGSVRLVWFNQPYRAGAIRPDTTYFISGQFELSSQRLSIMNPSMELASDFPVNTARIIPIYREAKGLKSMQIRKLLREVAPMINELTENLPTWITKQQELISYKDALFAIHFPKDDEHLDAARKRLGFEEVFALTLAGLLNKYELNLEKALAIPFNEQLAKDFVARLPFKLTDEQRKAVWQIYLDIQKNQPMNRLLEGDVGSGKTVVAVMSALMAIEQGYQVALMAPTELLARQHAETVYKLLEPLGYQNQVGLLVGSLKAADKSRTQKRIAVGDVRFIVGTHALIQEKVDMQNLGLVIIDEQHRFGVEQRKALQAKAGHALHVLNMTATPIPRSLALTLYGEMDISVIAAKPGGRKAIITEICSPNSRKQLYAKVEKQLAEGRQAFVVCPLISESDFVGAKSAETVFKEIQHEFSNYQVGLLHGKLKSEDKTGVMEQFVAHKLDILVSTTVIEVGVDVPNATVMLLENADRFGLAQIHQLRGRVGRSQYQGYCYLMMSDSSAPSKRLRALEGSADGFKLAELDLEMRGPGAIYGASQHGALDLRIAKLTDTKLIATARASAQEFIDKGEKLLQYPYLSERVKLLRAVTNLN